MPGFCAKIIYFLCFDIPQRLNYTYKFASTSILDADHGQIAQLVEQRTENPRVGGSTPSLATTIFSKLGLPIGSLSLVR